MVRIRMDGKGRALANISIERFWKTLKFEDIYLYRYDTLKQLRKGFLKYFRFYDSVRPHQSPKVIQQLLDVGADSKIENLVGYSALKIAKMHGDIDVIRILEKYYSASEYSSTIVSNAERKFFNGRISN